MSVQQINRVIVPSKSMALVSVARAKDALGIPVTDESQDAMLGQMISSVSMSVNNYCDRVFVVQTYRDQFRFGSWGVLEPLRTRQYPIVMDDDVPVLLTITIDGEVVLASEYELDPSTGCVYRINGCWAGSTVVVDYTAGYDPIPSDVQAATNDWLAIRWVTKGGRDPSIRSETIPDVISVVYQDSSSGSSGGASEGPPPNVCSWLVPYKMWFA